MSLMDSLTGIEMPREVRANLTNFFHLASQLIITSSNIRKRYHFVNHLGLASFALTILPALL
jgi:hypothetical protein